MLGKGIKVDPEEDLGFDLRKRLFDNDKPGWICLKGYQSTSEDYRTALHFTIKNM